MRRDPGEPATARAPAGDAVSARSCDVQPVIDWLIERAIHPFDMTTLVEELCPRLIAAGVPLLRINLAFRVLHPLFRALTLTWRRGEDHVEHTRFAHPPSHADWLRSPYAQLGRGQPEARGRAAHARGQGAPRAAGGAESGPRGAGDLSHHARQRAGRVHRGGGRGPARNEVARLESLTKTLGHRVLASDRFAAAVPIAWQHLGLHELRGARTPRAVFALQAAS